jgi:hypothetical protein
LSRSSWKVLRMVPLLYADKAYAGHTCARHAEPACLPRLAPRVTAETRTHR